MAHIDRFFADPGRSFFLFGPRGTGKSTWLRTLFPSALWVDLLDPPTQRKLLVRPESLKELVDGSPEVDTVVVDEVQRAPRVLDVVHQILESSHPRRFVMTGSSSRKLKRSGVDLLGGRAERLLLHPFMAAELGSDFQMERALEFGLVPLIWSSPSPKSQLAAYADLYMREEIQQEGLVRNIASFSRFLEAASFSHGSEINVSHIARECQVGRTTIDSWFTILEDLLLAFRLPVFTKRAKRAMTARAKLFFFDVGVFRSLRPMGPLDQPTEVAGPALEGLIAQHLRAWIDYGHPECRLFYWRTRGGSEVDFILYGPGVFQAIEVKHSQHVRRSDLRGLRTFRQDYPEANALFLYMGKEPLVIDGIPCLPCSDFLQRLRPNQDLPGLE